MARAAPVFVGVMLSVAARARRRSPLVPSSSSWSRVKAWMVVISPPDTPNDSCSTDSTGARQLVVQEAADTTWWRSGSYKASFTPTTTVRSS